MEETSDTCTRVESNLASLLQEVNKDDNKKNCFQTDSHTLCLASLNLDSLPPSVLDMQMITALILDHNKLTEIAPSVCENLQLLQKLSLIGNELESLPNSIGCLTRLKQLHLTANRLTKLPTCICELDKLTILKLADNSLKRLPSTMGAMTSLQQLNLSENELRFLPDSLCWLKNLEVLDCGDNKLKRLPINFGCLEGLRVLNLESNSITYLPNSVAMFNCLQVLDLSNNKLERLVPNLNCAHLLRKVYINRNLLTSLPQWFDSVHNLEDLSLRSNRLQHDPFPNGFGEAAKKLTKLDLAGNSVNKLCESFGELTSLRMLHLGSDLEELERSRLLLNGNWISFLPDNFGQLKNIRELRLDENRLKRLPLNFGCLICLHTLDLGQNDLSQLPDSFGNLKSLNWCQLSKNTLTALPDNFGNLSNLVDLRLDNNLLTELPNSIFKLARLETLDLFNNKLTTVPTGLQHLTNLTRLDLDENDFGLPVSEIPRIVFQLKYQEGDSAHKNNWRSRSKMNSPKRESSADKDTSNAKIDHDVVNSLESALIQGTTIWKKEGAHVLIREKFVRAVKDEERVVQELNHQYYSSDEDSDTDSCNRCSEIWDAGEGDNPDGELEDWDKEIMEYEIANCPYDDIPIRQPSETRYLEIDLMNMHKHINQEMFCPSDIHAKPVFRGRFEYFREEGQFDDAE